MQLRPLTNRIIIKKKKIETGDVKSKSGILLPDSAKRTMFPEGTVVAVGPGSRTVKGELIPLEVRVGEIVMYHNYGGVEVNIAEDTFVVLTEKDILGVKE